MILKRLSNPQNNHTSIIEVIFCILTLIRHLLDLITVLLFVLLFKVRKISA